MNLLYDALIAPHASNALPFLIDDEGGIQTFAAFVKRAAQIAHVLKDAGVGPDDRVLVQAGKSTEGMALYAACLQVGAVYLPLNPAYTLSELSYFIEDATPKVVVCQTRDRQAVAALCSEITASILTIDDTLPDAADRAADTFKTVPRGPDDLAGLLYTSGTTGQSKGAMMSHRNLLSNAVALKDLWQITDQDHLIHALPIFHTHGLFVAMNTALLAGATVRFMARFDPEQIIASLPAATLMMGVPTFYTRLLDHPDFTRKACANMRLFISGSAPLLAETHQAFRGRTGHRILERYGMTETNMITSNPYVGDRIAGTVGYPLPGTEVRITHDGTPVSAGEIGMIEVRGDNVFQGYWNMPEKTQKEMRADGFFITGDLGIMADDGRVRIVGREKDLIIAGGYNIYPKEVEDVLNTIEGVLESAVFGVPDPDIGESIVAALVFENQPLDETEIKAQVAAALAKFKNPRKYIVLTALPRNAMGKVQKAKLREDFS